MSLEDFTIDGGAVPTKARCVVERYLETTCTKCRQKQHIKTPGAFDMVRMGGPVDVPCGQCGQRMRLYRPITTEQQITFRRKLAQYYPLKGTGLEP